MEIERAAGVLIFRKINDKIEYLILQASYPPYHWTPPKGHLDPGEDEWTAALRETKEEANISPEQYDIYKDFDYVMKYDVNGRPKTVRYYLGKLKNAESVTLSHEHQNSKFCQLEECIKLTGFPEMEDLLRKAQAYIDKNKI
uniref:Bis(5'-nucleosyl)-tetraphosphatase [asymmetrical] n=1 Tax=Parastrongyloides trichosuri TaxID=131310 RepID=A0A0N5A184_PARTI